MFFSKSNYSFLVLFLIATASWAQKPIVTIQSVLVQKDLVKNGAKGLLISGAIDFHESLTLYPNDSLLQHAFVDVPLYLTITPKKDSANIAPALGYNAVFKQDKIVTKLKIKPSSLELKQYQTEFSWFLPYAALKLNPGTNSIAYDLSLYGKDGFNNIVSTHLLTASLNFDKPKTRVYEITLDSLTVKQLDVRGQAWDPTLGVVDPPDLDFRIVLGDFRVNSVHKGNSYTLDFSDKPRVFKFLISENDEVYIYLYDSDDYWDDAIANWKFNSTNMRENTNYSQKDNKANLEAFSLACRVGPLK